MDDDEEKITIKDQKSSLEKKTSSRTTQKKEIIEENRIWIWKKATSRKKEWKEISFISFIALVILSSPIYSGAVCSSGEKTF